MDIGRLLSYSDLSGMGDSLFFLFLPLLLTIQIHTHSLSLLHTHTHSLSLSLSLSLSHTHAYACNSTCFSSLPNVKGRDWFSFCGATRKMEFYFEILIFASFTRLSAKQTLDSIKLLRVEEHLGTEL